MSSVYKCLAILLALTAARFDDMPLSLSRLQTATDAMSNLPIQYVWTNGKDSNDGLILPKATIAAAIAALPPTGGTVVTSPDYSASFSSRLMVGSPTKFVHLEIGSGSKLTWNGNGCFLSISNGSTITGLGTLGGSWPTIWLGSRATPPLLCNSDSTGGQEYFAASGLALRGNGATNQTAPLIDLEAISIPSYLRDVLAWNWGGPILYLSSGSTSVPGYFGPFACDNCWLNGEFLAGAQPVVINQPAPYWQIQSVNFKGGSIEHAGSGYAELSCNGGASPGKNIGGVSLVGTYIENSYEDSDGLDFTNCGFNLSGVTAGGVGGTNLVRVSEVGGGDAFPSTIANLQDLAEPRFAKTIDNTVTGFTYSAPGGSLPFYTFAQPGYIGSEAIFDSTEISTGESCSSAASPASCGSAAAGSFVVPAGSVSVVVDTAMVTANSQILLTFDSSLGARLGVPCNITFAAAWVSARIPGTSFTITVDTAPLNAPACYSYEIIN
jgi:hypothetical protein